MTAHARTCHHLLAGFLVCAASVFAQPPDNRELSEALALYRRVLQTSPRSFQANSQAGIVLDLLGQYTDARTYLAKAIEVASSPEQKAHAQRSMAMSYAFEHDCRHAAKHETVVYQTYFNANDFRRAGEIASELARVCLEAGDLDVAYTWYHTGHEVALRERDLEPRRKDLWDFHWEHAQALIAARRGNHADAQQHVAAARVILDKSANPRQAARFAHLVGEIAFYTGDYTIALVKLQEADARDPSVLCLIAQTYEKVGDTAHAMDYYRKALAASNDHTVSAASAQPLARKKLESAEKRPEIRPA